MGLDEMETMNPKQYKNILVNALVNLGDVVLTTSAVALLRKIYPQARITMLVRPVVREAVENNPVIDEVLIFDYKAKENSWSKMWSMLQEIKSRHFDLSISFDRKSRPAILCFLACIPTRVGADRVFDDKPSKVTYLYTHTVHIAHDLENTLQAETYQEIVRGFSGSDAHAVPVMARIPAASQRKAVQLLDSLPADKRKIALCVRGTFPLKTWPKEYFAAVVTELQRKFDGAFFVVGAPGDKPYADEVIAACKAAVKVNAELSGIKEKLPILNFCGETNLLDLAALFQQTDLFVTVDTGATHIAATTGVKMVTVYGCTSPKRWHPYNVNARVLSYEPACCPCKVSAEECPSWPRPECLRKVTPEMVLAKCDEMMD